MSTPANRNIRRVKQDVSYTTAAPGYVVYEVETLGQEGRLTHLTFRMASGAATTCAIRIFEGAYDTTVDPSTVPDEDIVADYAAAAITASATTADIIENIKGDDGGAYYGRFDLLRHVAEAVGRSNEKLFVALTFDDTCSGVLRLRADRVA